MTTVVVPDASVVVAVLSERTLRAEAARTALAGSTLVAPSLLPYEVMQALRRLDIAGSLSADDATDAVRDLGTFPATLVPSDRLADRIWELRRNITAYDASYVALAEALRAPLVTFDQRLARAPGTRCAWVVPA